MPRSSCSGRASISTTSGVSSRTSASALALQAERRGAGSDVEARILEIEVALDNVHHVVVDLSLPPELDDRSPLGVEELAAQSLVVLRPLLDRAVVVRVEAGREAALAESIQAAQALGRVLAHPVLA